MSNVARRRFVLGLLVAAVLGVLLAWRMADSGPTASAGVGARGSGLTDSAGFFTVVGNATQAISPGVKAPMDLKLTNPHDVSMSVTDLRVSVQKVSAPNADHAHPCTIGDFAVDQVSGSHRVSVAARATSTLSSLGLPQAALPHLGMLDRPANQDGCKRASLTLAYTASGTLAK